MNTQSKLKKDMNYDAYEGSMNEHGVVWHEDIYIGFACMSFGI